MSTWPAVLLAWTAGCWAVVLPPTSWCHPRRDLASQPNCFHFFYGGKVRGCSVSSIPTVAVLSIHVCHLSGAQKPKRGHFGRFYYPLSRGDIIYTASYTQSDTGVLFRLVCLWFPFGRGHLCKVNGFWALTQELGRSEFRAGLHAVCPGGADDPGGSRHLGFDCHGAAPRAPDSLNSPRHPVLCSFVECQFKTCQRNWAFVKHLRIHRI